MLGEEVNEYIANQFNVRQELYSNTNNRSKNQIQLLNNQNAWIKMASGVALEIDEDKNLSPFAKEKLKNIEVPEGSLEKYKGKELAKKFVLFNGVSSLSDSWSGLKSKKGFGTSNFLNSNDSYSKSDFGYVPMPGITGFNIKSLTRGSLKKATIQYKLHSKDQFDIFELLYLRLGYTVLIEFGNNIYTNNENLSIQKIGQTLIEDKENGFFSDKFSQGGSYLDILDEIENLRNKYDGNYGGFLGKIVNFEWSIDSLGSYDVTLNLISLGDVIESLKVNVSANKSILDFIHLTLPDSENKGEVPEGGNIKDQISSMLYMYKYINNEQVVEDFFQSSELDKERLVKLKLTNLEGSRKQQYVGQLLKTEPEGGLSTISQTHEYYIKKQSITVYLNEGGNTKIQIPQSEKFTETFTADEKTYNTLSGKSKFKQDIYKWKYGKKLNHLKTQLTPNANNFFKRTLEQETEKQLYKIEAVGKIIDEKKETIINPLKFFSLTDGFQTLQQNSNFYIRLGALMQYINSDIVPQIKNKNDGVIEKVKGVPIVNIHDYNNSDNNTYIRDGMFTLPQQLSLDPRICVVKNQISKKLPKIGKQSGDNAPLVNYTNIMCYDELEPFRELDLEESEKEIYGIGNTFQLNPNRAYIKNIYLNHTFIEDILSNKVDENGDISLFNFLSEICSGINKALGGVNNLEPVIDETKNLLYIGDSTPIPNQIKLKPSTPYTLNLFGFDLKGKGNFIRKLDIKTTISPEYASMITIGATSAGYVKGTNGTAFSKWNKGLVDRFKEAASSPNETADPLGVPEPLENYINQYVSMANNTYVGFKPDDDGDDAYFNGEFDTETINKSISIVTEFYKYALATKSLENMDSDGITGGIGFIPFKMSFTMNGIEGIKIYNTLHVNSSFLPQAYGKTLDFIITGVDHDIKNNDWETTINTLVQPKSTTPNNSTVIENYDYLFTDAVNEAIEAVNTTVSETKAGNAPNQPSVPPTRNPEKAKGTLGTRGKVNDLAPDALSITEWANVITRSGTKKELRQRIVGIAASYIGQDELPGNNQGWHDQLFEDKIKKPNVTDKGWGWYAPHPWCAWFVSRVMYEAHVVGNALVKEAKDEFKSIWKNRYKEGANVKPFSAGVLNTEQYFKKTLKRDVRRSKAIKTPDLIQPGDIVYYNISHIGIVAKVNKDSKGQLKSLDIINGNTSAKPASNNELRDGGTAALARNYSINKIRGFSRLFES